MPNHDCFRDRKAETDRERRKRIGIPTEDIKEILKEAECEDAIPKLEEHSIDAKVFWTLGDADFEELLGITSFGKKKTLSKNMNEIRKKHEEERDKEYEEQRKVDQKEVLKLVQGPSMKVANDL